MKKWLTPAFRNILTGCMAFSFWISASSPCLLFFGECKYPRKDDYKE